MRHIWKEPFSHASELFSGESCPIFRLSARLLSRCLFEERNREDSEATGTIRDSRDSKYQEARELWMAPITDADMRTRMGAVLGFYDLGRRAKRWTSRPRPSCDRGGQSN